MADYRAESMEMDICEHPHDERFFGSMRPGRVDLTGRVFLKSGMITL